MKSVRSIRSVLLVGAAAAALAGCADTDIVTPGVPAAPVAPVDPAPTPPAPPAPPAATTVELVPAAGCPTGTVELALPAAGIASAANACSVSGTITSDLTIPADVPIALNGPVFVGDGATLTIEPGAILFGSAGADFLTVDVGGTLEAAGTVDDPIIFTARIDVEDMETGSTLVTPTTRGQWGGLILNGDAPINACADGTAEGGTVGCTNSGEGGTGTFGGADPTDSSGTLQFLQVRYAGFEITDENELNGIAFQGTGSGTVVNNIQVFNNADDGVEFFGGTTNAQFVALNGNADDSLDWTDGWTGNLQFLLIEHAVDDADQGIEADNNGDVNDALPRSAPTISNFTIVGGGDEAADADSDIGALIREGTAATLVNGIITGGFTVGALDIDDEATFSRFGASGVAGDEILTIESLLLDDDTPIVLNNQDLDDDPATGDADGNDPDVDADGNPVVLTDILGADENIVIADATLSSEFFPGATELDIPVFDVTADEFFDETAVVGAFRTFDTPELNWATGWTFGLVADPDVATECPAGTTATGEAFDGLIACDIPDPITSDLTLTPGVVYQISGLTFVGLDQGPDVDNPNPVASVTLTIEPGLTLFGSEGSDVLVVNRGSMIESNGTATDPVIMTARADLEDTITPTTRGQWGGLVINGRAQINACADGTATGGTIGCTNSGEGGTGTFGGDFNADDSGSVQFTQVRFAGFEITDENELNGIAFQGTGSGLTVDSIQVVNNADDGIEFFGGATNAKRVLLTGNADDSIDWTDGWIGSLQFAIVQHAVDDADQGIEADNNGDDNLATPVSNPTLSNVTLIGNADDDGDSDIGALIREGTNGEFYNFIVVDFNEGLDIDDEATFTNLVDATDGIVIESWFLDNVDVDFLENNQDLDDDPATGDADGNDQDVTLDGTPVDISDVVGADGNNVVTGDVGATGLTGTSFVADAPGIVPGAPITDVTAFDPTTLTGDFFEAGTFLGAVSGADDTSFDGWTFSFDE